MVEDENLDIIQAENVLARRETQGEEWAPQDIERGNAGLMGLGVPQG